MTRNQFDPARSREILLGDVGYEWSLRGDFSHAMAVGGLAGTASSNLNVAIECLLVGFDEPAERLLKMALDWVQIAIETNERPQWYAPNGTEALYYHTRALCNWLLFNHHDIESLQCAVAHEDRYLTEAKPRPGKTEVSYSLSTYVDAGAFNRALEIFAATPGLSPPSSSAIHGEGRMSYVVARHRLGLQYAPEEFTSLSARFLYRNVDAWLGAGHWSTAAGWMKIIHWNDADPPISAKDALLKCYDYLPGRERPE